MVFIQATITSLGVIWKFMGAFFPFMSQGLKITLTLEGLVQGF